MQTIMLWTAGVFATTTMLSPSAPPKPSSAIASLASASRRSRYAVVDPRPRDDLGAVLRSDVVLVELDDRVDRVGRDEALLGEQRLERAGAQLDLDVRDRGW